MVIECYRFVFEIVKSNRSLGSVCLNTSKLLICQPSRQCLHICLAQLQRFSSASANPKFYSWFNQFNADLPLVNIFPPTRSTMTTRPPVVWSLTAPTSAGSPAADPCGVSSGARTPKQRRRSNSWGTVGTGMQKRRWDVLGWYGLSMDIIMMCILYQQPFLISICMDI